MLLRARVTSATSSSRLTKIDAAARASSSSPQLIGGTGRIAENRNARICEDGSRFVASWLSRNSGLRCVAQGVKGAPYSARRLNMRWPESKACFNP